MEARIIPANKAYLYRQINITSWYGIDAIELKDGTYFIKESDYQRLSTELRINRTDPVLKIEKEVVVKDELGKLTKKDLRETDFKSTELSGIEVKGVKL